MNATIPGTVTVKAVIRSTGKPGTETAWRTRLEPEDHADPREMAEAAARQWYEDTDQSGHAVVTLNVTGHDSVIWSIRVHVGPEIVARGEWNTLAPPDPRAKP